MEEIEREKKERLDSGDIITLGIFIAIIIVIYMIIGMLTHLLLPPAHQWFGASLAVLISGVIYILICIKIQKNGIYLINGVIQGLIITLLLGQRWLLIFYLLGGLLAELIFFKSQDGYNNKKNLIVGYIIYQTMSQFGNYLAFYFFTDYLIDMMVSMYADITLPQPYKSFWENYSGTYFLP